MNCFIDSLTLRPRFTSALPAGPMCSNRSCSVSRVSRYCEVVRMAPRCLTSAPTLREMDISLSLRIMTIGVCV